MICFQFILLFLLYYVVISHSNGDATTCNTLDPSLGCQCVTGDGFKGNCKVNCKGRVMGWVTLPKRTADYTVRSGDSSVDEDATEYTPDEYLTIHVRALKLNKKYIGILLYAVDSNEVKVGQWDIADKYPNPFWLPGGSCGGKAIMHTGVDRKNYHHAFRFKAPSQGIGNITFRCLLKEEGPNVGYFWWPNLEKDLQLTEKKVTLSPHKWYRGTVGQSCDDVCKSRDYSCDLNALQRTNSATALMDAVSRHYSYKAPVLSSCSDIAPTSGGGKDGWIWYHDDNCTSDGRTVQQVTCSSKSIDPIDGARLCACKGGDIPDPSDFDAPNPDSSIGYTRTTLNLSLTAALIMITHLLTRRSGVLFFGILFATFNSAHGHNWIVSPSRSMKASSVAPCRPRISTIPHIQVNKGQEFNFEWSTGHGQFSYIVILARKDYTKLQGINITMLEEYIAKAPQSSHFENQFQRVHVRSNAPVTKAGENDLYEEVIYPNSSDYVVRPDLADAKKSVPNYLLYRYKSIFLKNDVHVEYQNEKYKWIEAVYKHQHNFHRPSQMDLVRLRVLAHNGPGEYIVFWKWKGYQDCIDVEVLPDTTPVTDIYGSTDGDTTFVKIDHCRFESFLSFKSGCYQVLTTPQQCMNECNGTVQECPGVNVVPLRLPSNVNHQDQSDTESHINWNMCTKSQSDSDAKALKDEFAGLPDDTQVCFSPVTVKKTDLDGLYTISHDPEDLIFYSTCYLKVVERIFKNNWASPAPSEPVIPPWYFGSECVSCSDFQKNYHLPDLLPSTWKLAKCINCDIEPGLKPEIPSLPEVTWNILAKGHTCDLRDFPEIRDTFEYAEHDNCNPGFVCAKKLKVVGSSNVLHDECQLLVTNDPGCSNIVMYESKNKNCYCWKAASCCGKCSPVDKASFWDIYDLGPNDPDPNCARGTLFNGYCCPSHCGLCGTTDEGCREQEGMCCATPYDRTARSCEHNAPPCVTSDYVPQ